MERLIIVADPENRWGFELDRGLVEQELDFPFRKQFERIDPLFAGHPVMRLVLVPEVERRMNGQIVEIRAGWHGYPSPRFLRLDLL